MAQEKNMRDFSMKRLTTTGTLEDSLKLDSKNRTGALKIKAACFTAALVFMMLLSSGQAIADYVWYEYQGHEYALTLNWQSWIDNEAVSTKTLGW